MIENRKFEFYQYIHGVLKKYRFKDSKIHGLYHFYYVAAMGHCLCKFAKEAGKKVDEDVVIWFAYLHDVCRLDDGIDIEHGERASDYIQLIKETYLHSLNKHQLYLLQTACKYHNRIHRHGDITVDICFDADRLDLPRCGMPVKLERLATDEAKIFYLYYHGNYQNYISIAILEFNQLDFDVTHLLCNHPKYAVRLNEYDKGTMRSPFSCTPWKPNCKSVKSRETLSSAIFAYDDFSFANLSIAYNHYRYLYDGMKFYQRDIMVLILQYDDNALIGKIRNTISVEGSDEIILSKANVIGMCRFSENVECDIKIA